MAGMAVALVIHTVHEKYAMYWFEQFKEIVKKCSYSTFRISQNGNGRIIREKNWSVILIMNHKY